MDQSVDSSRLVRRRRNQMKFRCGNREGGTPSRKDTPPPGLCLCTNLPTFLSLCLCTGLSILLCDAFASTLIRNSVTAEFSGAAGLSSPFSQDYDVSENRGNTERKRWPNVSGGLARSSGHLGIRLVGLSQTTAQHVVAGRLPEVGSRQPQTLGKRAK